MWGQLDDGVSLVMPCEISVDEVVCDGWGSQVLHQGGHFTSRRPCTAQHYHGSCLPSPCIQTETIIALTASKRAQPPTASCWCASTEPLRAGSLAYTLWILRRIVSKVYLDARDAPSPTSTPKIHASKGQIYTAPAQARQEPLMARNTLFSHNNL